MKTKFLFAVITICTICQAYTQETRIQQLKIGDTVPEYVFTNVVNFKSQTVKLSEFKGKPLLIDFWATWCIPCVASFPKIDSIQHEFGDKIQIFLVSQEKKDKIERYFSQVAKTGLTHLPSASEEYKFGGYFNVRIVPQYIWINSEGIVSAITGVNEVNRTNIEQFVKNDAISLKEKQDGKKFKFNPRNDLLLLDTNYAKKVPIKQYSVLSGYIEGSSALHFIPRDGRYKERRVLAVKVTIAGLYQILHGQGFKYHRFPTNRTIVTSKDSLLFRYDPEKTELENAGNLYSYDLIIPEADSIQLFRKMEIDLVNNFNYVAERKIIKRRCILLQATNWNTIASSHEKPQLEYSQFYISMKNHPVASLVSILENYLDNGVAAVIDESGYAGKLDIVVNGDIKNIVELNKELNKNGLKASYVLRDIEMLVISDK